MGMQFRDDLDLARWLALSKRGQAMMRDVLLGKDGDKFMDLMRDRVIQEATVGGKVVAALPTLALVEIEPPMVRVYGEKHLRVHICERPATDDSELEIMTERWLDNTIPKAFRRVFYPGMVRKAAVIRNERVREWSARLDETRMNMSIINTLNQLVTG